MNRREALFGLVAVVIMLLAVAGQGQSAAREFPVAAGALVEVRNPFGRIEIATADIKNGEISIGTNGEVLDPGSFVTATPSAVRIEPKQQSFSGRLDLFVRLPARSRVRLETASGEVRIAGNFASIEVKTVTGTIITEIPTADVSYRLEWNQSRPRVVSDFELERVKEQSAGRFVIKGKYRNNEANVPTEQKTVETAVSLNVFTERGIVLLNVPPAEVMNNLGEKPLTEAAKAIIRSGDSLLMESIRRASPKYFGEYLRTLPPIKAQPELISARRESPSTAAIGEFRAILRVVDAKNRAVAGLGTADFRIEGLDRAGEILDVRQTSSPVNLVLLLDVSGSVENYTTFIRKAARAFIETVDPRDRVSIIIFNEDVRKLAGFTSDKRQLSASLDTFDAGGGTAYYDAIAFTLADVLRPLKGERTAIVILTDGDDNRSFLPFEALLGSIEESGALIYPLYVPTGLIAAGDENRNEIDPFRSRYLGRGLTSRAEDEGRRLASVSGGTYYSISRLGQIQEAYDDIVAQLRTAYEIRFRAAIATNGNRPDPRLKIRVVRPNFFVQVGPVIPAK